MKSSKKNVTNLSGCQDIYQSQVPLEFAQFAIERISNGILYLKSNGKIIYANCSACQSLKYSPKELCSMYVFDIDASFSPETQGLIWKKHWEDIKKCKSTVIESHHRTKDGSIFPVEVITNYLEFEGEEYNVIQVRNIRDRLQSESRLKQQIERESIQTQKLNQKNKQLKVEIKERQEIEAKLLLSQKSLKSINEKLEQIVRERTNKLQQSQQLLQIIIDTVPQCIFWKDRNLNYLGCNLSFAHFLGFENPDEVCGQADFQLLWNNANAYSLLKGDILVMDLELPEIITLQPQKQADEIEVWLESHKVPLYGSNQEIIGVLGTFQDITKHKKTEEYLKKLNLELQQAITKADAASRAKSDFLANISHEVRTPLNGILGYAQVLLSKTNTTNKEKDIFRTIEKCGYHLLILINDILELSKIELGKLEVLPNDFHFSTFIDTISEMCCINAEKKKIIFQIDLPLTLPKTLHGDEKRLRQVLINLLGNAIKFTDRGEVTLKITEIDYQEKQKDLELPKIILRFEVIDTGIGIDSKQLQQIFHAFERVDDRDRPAEGTGLGLTISRQLLKLMDSELHVVSKPNLGSTFWFDLSFLVVSRANIQDKPLQTNVKYIANQESTVSLALIAPPPEEIEILYELAMFGSMKKICERAKYLEQLNPNYRPFSQKLQELARGFQEKAIVNLIEEYLTQISPEELDS